ncbi:MAG: MipA/OmpV family protein [Aestuariivirga sp.]
MKVVRLAAACVCLAALSAGQGVAAEVKLGVGAAALPDYEGSNEYTFIPFPSFEIEHEGFKLKSSRLGVEADLIPILGLDAGPIVRYNFGRDSGVDDDVVSLLPEIGESVEVGGYIAGGLPLNLLGLDSNSILFARVDVIQGLDGGHEGLTADVATGLITDFSDQFSLITAATASFMSGGYADSMFGISAAGSAASGLAAYDPDGGLKDVGVAFIATYEWTDNWSGTLIGSYKRLVGDAADSPIVKDRGSPDQFFAGVSIGYAF